MLGEYVYIRCITFRFSDAPMMINRPKREWERVHIPVRNKAAHCCAFVCVQVFSLGVM